MSSGPVTPYVDFGGNVNDSNENNTASIQPINDGEGVNQTVMRRPTEIVRVRSEVLRGRAVDSLFLENADRAIVIAGPGKVTWPGSTTAAQSGIPVVTDTLWILPMLTPGFAQANPVPPVASAFGVLHLKRTDSVNTIAVTSQRRSYAAGDQINVQVTPGAVFSCTLDVEDTGALRRTIKIVATGATTLGAVISALNALTPPAPDNTALVSAALEGGGLVGDLILTTQARQFVVGNYDGEGHAITPANLASFFAGNPTQVLAEGDTLCVSYAMLFDTASNGGRRQAVPENSNTAIPAGSYFNSRVHPENLFGALPICKVVNGRLVFRTGCEVPQGVTAFDLTGTIAADILYAGGGAWADGVTNPATTVEAQLDKVISDLAGALGSGKIQGVVNGTDLTVGTVKQQLDDLSTNWLKMGRVNTISAAQTFSALITANLGLLAAANQHVTLSGTGRYKHGDYVKNVSPIIGDGTGWAWNFDPITVNGWLASTGAGSWFIPIQLDNGERIKSLTFELWGDSAADLTGGVFIRAKNSIGSQDFSINVVNTPASWNDQFIDVTDHTFADGDSYWLVLTASAVNLRVGAIRVVYDLP